MRARRTALPALLLALALGGCASQTHTVTAFRATPAAPTTGPESVKCREGVMGGCVAHTAGVPRAQLAPAHGQLIPDVSEYQSCPLYGPTIFRIYEAGTDRQDRAAACHARELARRRVWAGAYMFARNRSCGYQATRTVAIARQFPVIRVLVVDAEVYLAPGLVSCIVHAFQHQGYTVVTYTGPGTWPGGRFVTPVWVAAYPFRPACFSNACPYVAHQFSETADCAGKFGDCSIDEGITSLGVPPPNPLRKVRTAGLLRHRASLRAYLATHGCRRLERLHRQRGPRCRAAESAGRNINHELHRRGVR